MSHPGDSACYSRSILGPTDAKKCLARKPVHHRLVACARGLHPHAEARSIRVIPLATRKVYVCLCVHACIRTSVPTCVPRLRRTHASCAKNASSRPISFRISAPSSRISVLQASPISTVLPLRLLLLLPPLLHMLRGLRPANGLLWPVACGLRPAMEAPHASCWPACTKNYKLHRRVGRCTSHCMSETSAVVCTCVKPNSTMRAGCAHHACWLCPIMVLVTGERVFPQMAHRPAKTKNV